MNKISEGRRQLSPILKTCFSDETMKTMTPNLWPVPFVWNGQV